MGHCYSLDLRVRVVDFVEAGHSCRAAAEHFDVSESFAIKLVRRTRHTGSPAPARQGRPPGGGKLVPYETFLIQTVEGRAGHHHARTGRKAAGAARDRRGSRDALALPVPVRLQL
jgi:hypothetical protein